jgi:hypothetical protein
VKFIYQKVVKLVVEFFNQKGGPSVVEFTYQKVVKLVVEFFNQKRQSVGCGIHLQKDQVGGGILNQKGSFSVLDFTDQNLPSLSVVESTNR